MTEPSEAGPLAGRVAVVTGAARGIGRTAEPEDVAPLVVFLASDQARMVRGSSFAATGGDSAHVSHAFLALGLLTAVVGALFCFRERHIKRLLAFSTISHAGMFLTGFALLTPLGLAGAAVYVASHALVKAALFLCVGIVLHRLGSVNESWLHGRGRVLPVTGAVFTLVALGLADLPPFTTYLGKGWIEDSGNSHGMIWITVVLIFSSVLVGGAVLRVAGGVFYGLGDPPSEDPQMARESSEETSETDEDKQRTPLTMIIPPALLIAGTIVIGLLPHLGPVIEAAAVRFQDQVSYNVTVLSGAPGSPLPSRAGGHHGGRRDHRPGRVPQWVRFSSRSSPCTGSGCRCCAGALNRDRADAAAAAVPEWRGQRLCDLDRDRRGLPGRRLALSIR